MTKRYVPNKQRSVRQFNAQHKRTHVKNVRRPMRGGISL